MNSERLTMHTPDGACLILKADNEKDARQELMEKFKEACNKLAELEDKLENETLIELPCKVGDYVYYLGGHYERHKTKVYVDEIKKGIVDHITIGQKGIPQIDVCDDENVWTTFDCVDDIGKIVFFTKETAEKALEELDNEK